MCYSPVRHSLPESRTFDLHVLGTPPAFILSQDQTRHPFYKTSFHKPVHIQYFERSKPSYNHLAVRRFSLRPVGTGEGNDSDCYQATVAVLLSTFQLSKYHQKQVMPTP